MTSSIGWSVVASSGLVGLTILLPAVGWALVGVDDPSTSLSWAFLAVTLIAFTAAGFVAGHRRRDIPMIHGCLAALSTLAIAQLIGIVVLVTRGDEIMLAGVAFGALLATSCGVGGALGADWLTRRRRRGRPISVAPP